MPETNKEKKPSNTLASGLNPEEESIFQFFLYIIPTFCGSRLAMDVLANQPDYYWSVYWSEFFENPDKLVELDWLMRVIALPLDCYTNQHWPTMTEKARDHIKKKSQGMAKRAVALMTQWREEARNA